LKQHANDLLPSEESSSYAEEFVGLSLLAHERARLAEECVSCDDRHPLSIARCMEVLDVCLVRKRNVMRQQHQLLIGHVAAASTHEWRSFGSFQLRSSAGFGRIDLASSCLFRSNFA
jgi:hypothetical protein